MVISATGLRHCTNQYLSTPQGRRPRALHLSLQPPRASVRTCGSARGRRWTAEGRRSLTTTPCRSLPSPLRLTPTLTPTQADSAVSDRLRACGKSEKMGYLSVFPVHRDTRRELGAPNYEQRRSQVRVLPSALLKYCHLQVKREVKKKGWGN